MRRIGDLMKEIGFKPDSDLDTQKAFIQHLVRVAEVSESKRKLEHLFEQNKQLELNLDMAELSPESVKATPVADSTKVLKKPAG